MGSKFKSHDYDKNFAGAEILVRGTADPGAVAGHQFDDVPGTLVGAMAGAWNWYRLVHKSAESLAGCDSGRGRGGVDCVSPPELGHARVWVS